MRRGILFFLWGATLFVVSWAIALISAIVASKGIDEISIEVDGTISGKAPS